MGTAGTLVVRLRARGALWERGMLGLTSWKGC